jgi:mediator of RNA polymerase II transcription subunit 17
LRRSDDGTITLDQGLAHVEPETLRVRIRAGSIETGSSKVPAPVPEDGPIESLILEARNTIFAQELWQELNREARTLGAYGVRSKDDTLVFPLSEEKTIVLDLVSLGDLSPHSSGVDDHVAEGITIAFNLLLTLAHRQNHRKRTQPPVSISGEKQATQAYNLLRPFLTRIKHQETVSRLHTLLRPLCRALGSALPGFSPEYNMNTAVHEIGSDYPEPEKVLMRLTNNLQTATTFTITEDISMIITVRTNMAQVGSTFTVEASAALIGLCPPPPARFDTAFKTFSALQNYIHYAVACGLAFTVSSKPAGDGPVLSSLMGSMEGWQITAQPNVLRKTLPTQQTKQLAISILSERQRAKIRVAWELTKSDIVLDNENSLEKKLGEARKGSNGATKRGDGWFEWTDLRSESWDDNEGEVVESLMQIVEAAGK